MTNFRPLLLDASVRVAYERELTRRAQAFVVQAITDGRTLVTSALSLALAAQVSLVDAAGLELAQVVHEAAATRAVVLTYEPKLYWGQPVDVMDMRPQ